MMIKFMDLTWQHRKIEKQLLEVLQEIFEKSAYIGGEQVRGFESEFAEFCEAKHCIGVANGTDALEIAIEALALPPRSTILVPANSFVASAECVSRCGLSVRFIPFDERTMLLDEKIIAKYLDESVSAVIAVHLYGNPVDVSKIREITDKFNIKIIEDCAQSHGARINNRPVGTLGHVGCFSFYPGKNLGAYGDAGAIVTNSDEAANLIRRISNHGRLGKFDHELIGRNSRLDNIQAAVLRLKLRNLPEWTKRRVSNANTYLKAINTDKLSLPRLDLRAKHVFHHFVVRTERRDELKNFLSHEGVETGIHYPMCIPSYSAYASHNYEGPDYGRELLSLPVAEHLDEADILKVAEKINLFFN